MGAIIEETLIEARTAAQNSQWETVLDRLRSAQQDTGLSGADLELLGEALWWTGSADDALVTYDKAFGAFERAGEPIEAARLAAKLAYLAYRRRNQAVGNGWLTRAEELLKGEAESVAHGWLLLLNAVGILQTEKDWDKGITLLKQASEVANRVGDRGIDALAKSFIGHALIQKGDWTAGVKIADEAALIALSGESDLRATGDVYCNTIAMCRDLGDYRRASEWTDEAERWMRAHSVGGYPGVCQVHRAELKRLKGLYKEAESEAKVACLELERFHILDAVGVAHYEIGEARRRMGDFDEAQDSFDRAYEYGTGSQPGRALLLADRGDMSGAAESIASSLSRIKDGRNSQTGQVSLSRGRLLPAQVEISIAIGDLDTAKRATEDLEEISQMYDAVSWKATAQTCRGSLELAEANPEEAIRLLSGAWRLWHEIDFPYESAQTRTLLGRARAETGDTEGARLEYQAARAVFSKLDAKADVRRLDKLLGNPTVEQDQNERVARTFLFTDIVTSTDLIELIGDAAWEDLLAWHDRIIRETLSEAGGEEVHHTGDGFFVTFESSNHAIDWAVGMQRRLAKHRRDHGFAPEVRMGMHYSVATHRGDDYSGRGVHVAARIGSEATGGEVLVSAPVLENAGEVPYPVSESRSIQLKGISEPIEVHSIVW